MADALALESRPHGSRAVAMDWVRMLPARLIMAYLATTLLLFVYWPINWPIYDPAEWFGLFAYVAACFALIYFLFGMGASGAPPSLHFAGATRVIIGGAMVAVVLLAPSSYFYAGRWPWQFLEALQDQGEAYRGLQNTLEDTAGQRGPIALARALAAPLTFAVLPLGILNWARLSRWARVAVIVAPTCSLAFSILRGTDREFADVFIVGGSALLVSIARQAYAKGSITAVLGRYWRPAVLVLVFLALATSLFATRKEARLGGVDSVCAVGTGICVDLADPKITWMGDRTLFAVSIFTMSVSQGYYGLALGMSRDFDSTWGLGHSPSVTAMYEGVTGDRTLGSRTYTARIALDGWPPEYFWSTAILWFANDVGFAGVLPLMALIGFAWGRSWRASTRGGSDPAAVVFCLFMVMMFYLPANNQVFISFDGYTTFIAWLVVWARSSPGGATPRALRA